MSPRSQSRDTLPFNAMNRRTAILLLIVLVTLSTVAIYILLPKRYQLGERMVQTIAFWNNKEAFVFLNLQVSGRSTNFIQEKLSHSHFGMPFMLLGWNDMFYRQQVLAYHLLPSGKLDRFSLPPDTAASGSWSLRDGKLQLTPATTFNQPQNGFRWEGEKFIPLTPVSKQRGVNDANAELEEDNLDAEVNEYPAFIQNSERANFRKAGWHVKALNGYEGRGRGASLGMQLSHETFHLAIHSFPLSGEAFDFGALKIGARSVEIASEKPGQEPQTLWQQTGWREIPKTEYRTLAQQYARRTRVPAVPWFWLVALLGLLVWKFVHWGNILVSFGGAKRRILKNLPTTYSFPPVSPGQFPALDSAALDRYTREFEALGFTRLLDLSLVADSPIHPGNFCRLMVHSRNHCFAEITQFFPQRKAPLPLKCSIQSYLQEGWTVAFSDRKPQAASSLLRRPKAIAVSMPEASPSDLLASFLRMRDQVCIDLGISPLKDDTLEAYMAKVQRTACEMRDAVQQRNSAFGLSQVYYRRFSLMKTRPEYVWLGDYPKVAEERKQGYAVAYGAKS
jgi:hypothetical protein